MNKLSLNLYHHHPLVVFFSPLGTDGMRAPSGGPSRLAPSLQMSSLFLDWPREPPGTFVVVNRCTGTLVSGEQLQASGRDRKVVDTASTHRLQLVASRPSHSLPRHLANGLGSPPRRVAFALRGLPSSEDERLRLLLDVLGVSGPLCLRQLGLGPPPDCTHRISR